MKGALAGLSLLLAAGCSGVDALNAITPDEGTRRIEGLAYAEGPRGRLDLYVPPDGVTGETPLLVFFYGGGWSGGAREDFRFVGQAFAARGWLVAIPDYRLVPEVTFPGFVEDGADAVASLPRLLATNGIAPDRRLVLAGHSAGAHLAAMLALDGRFLGEHGLSPCRDVAAFLGLAGPYDFLPGTGRTVVEAFGPPPQDLAGEPITHVGPGAPPALLMTGTADVTVLPRNAQVLAAALANLGRPVRLHEYPGVGHADLVAALAVPLRHIAPVLDDADAGLRAMLAEPAQGCP